jgi:hypothetical protein
MSTTIQRPALTAATLTNCVDPNPNSKEATNEQTPDRLGRRYVRADGLRANAGSGGACHAGSPSGRDPRDACDGTRGGYPGEVRGRGQAGDGNEDIEDQKEEKEAEHDRRDARTGPRSDQVTGASDAR